MKISGQLRFIVIDKQANSLHSLIADGTYRATSLGRNEWKKLIGAQGSLQQNCNKEGFNAVGTLSHHSKALVILLMRKWTATIVTPELGLVPEDILITPLRVET